MLPEAKYLPSGENMTQKEIALFVKEAFSLRESMLHSFILLSSLPEATYLLSGENATELILPLCPVKVATSFYSYTLHSFTVLSSLPEAR